MGSKRGVQKGGSTFCTDPIETNPFTVLSYWHFIRSADFLYNPTILFKVKLIMIKFRQENRSCLHTCTKTALWGRYDHDLAFLRSMSKWKSEKLTQSARCGDIHTTALLAKIIPSVDHWQCNLMNCQTDISKVVIKSYILNCLFGIRSKTARTQTWTPYWTCRTIEHLKHQSFFIFVNIESPSWSFSSIPG